EVMQRHHRLEATRAQALHHLAIVFQRILIPPRGRRLDATPFDGQPMRGVTVGRGAIKISLPAPAFPPIAGPAGPLTLSDVPGPSLPPPKIRINALPLDLIPGRR